MGFSPTAYVIEQSWIPVAPRGLDFYGAPGSASGELLDAAAPAAREILDDPKWAAKISRALEESYADNVQALDEFRANL